MHDSVQTDLPLEVLIQNNSRMCPGRVATFQCGECSLPSDTENNHNVQFLFSCDMVSVPVNSLQLQINLKPNPNEVNTPHIPLHHEFSRCLKKRHLEHSNQIIYIKRFIKIIGYCSFEQ